jgi:hypothetical protein
MVGMDDTIPLTDLSRRLSDLTGGQVSYHRLYKLILDSEIPAEQAMNGRWRIKFDDVPKIADKLGFTKESTK